MPPNRRTPPGAQAAPPPSNSPRLTLEQAAQIQELKVAKAYRDVFGAPPSVGAPDNRSEAQKLVWKDLEIAGYFRMNAFLSDKNGALCPLRGAFADGRRSLFLYILSNVSFEPKLEVS